MSLKETRPLIPTKPGVRSPFVPGTYLQFAWDSVSLSNALACWRRYQYNIIEGWEHRGGRSAIALTFGIAFHSAMQFYQEEIAKEPDHDGAILRALVRLHATSEFAALPNDDDISELRDDTPEDDDGITFRNSKLRTKYYLVRAVVWYLEHYRKDPIKTWILQDGTPAVEQSFRIELFDDFILSGHFDRVGIVNDRFVVVDYKTTKSLSSQFFSAFDLSHQLTGYFLAGKLALPSEVSEVVVDGIALLVGGAKFGRAPSRRTPSQVEEYLDDVKAVTDAAEVHSDRKGADPSYDYPKNTMSCYFCDFKDICRQPREFRRRYLAMNFEQKRPWNPLENR